MPDGSCTSDSPTRRSPRLTSLFIAIALTMVIPGCNRNAHQPTLPAGVTLESQIPDGISWASLLVDASDLESLTTAPSPNERSVLFSSSADTQKVSLAHLAPNVLGDLDHGFFVRVEDTDRGVEATLAEATGPGAITGIWSANPVGMAVLYVDNEEVPVLQLPFADLLAGRFLPVQYPFAAVTALGHNLHFPIVHTNRFRLAIRVPERKHLSELFYHVAWNALEPNSPIHAFDSASIQSSAPLLGSLATRFTDPLVSTNGYHTITRSLTLTPGISQIVFASDRPGMIRSLEISANRKTTLADIWMEARWDGRAEPAVSCPLSMLAGVSAQFENTHSVPCTVSGGRVTWRWPMPFGPGSTLSLVNKGSRPHDIAVALLVRPTSEAAAGPPLRFHARYQKQEALALNTRNIVNLGTLSGPGHIVGCCLRVDSRSATWWGEGDEIIWLDRHDVPSWRGTGTEDYFGFAWCSDTVFDHPLRGQTRADGSRSNRRIASMHRYHLLDRLPFHRFARFDMEAWGLSDGSMDYETTLLWYAPLAWEYGAGQ